MKAYFQSINNQKLNLDKAAAVQEIAEKYAKEHDCAEESSSCDSEIKHKIEDIQTKMQLNFKNSMENNKYELPENDETLVRKSNMLQNLLTIFNLKDQMKVVTDLAFDAVDEDGSGGLD